MASKKAKKKLKTIGRLEKVDFPEWGLEDIDAKVDTGAYTSSLHCHHIKPYSNENGERYVRFRLLDPSHEIYNDKLFELPLFRTKKVKSSNGEIEKRMVVKTLVCLLDEKFEAQFTLTDRSEMKYPVLLGRRLLRNRFLVDVTQKNT